MSGRESLPAGASSDSLNIVIHNVKQLIQSELNLLVSLQIYADPHMRIPRCQ
jgi:hypothetical protein